MKSKIIEQDHDDLIELNRALSPEERIEAFYQHSQLLVQLSLTRKADAKQDTGK